MSMNSFPSLLTHIFLSTGNRIICYWQVRRRKLSCHVTKRVVELVRNCILQSGNSWLTMEKRVKLMKCCCMRLLVRRILADIHIAWSWRGKLYTHSHAVWKVGGLQMWLVDCQVCESIEKILDIHAQYCEDEHCSVPEVLLSVREQ